MNRLKRWLIEKILPIWAREELLQENDRLRTKVQEQAIHIKELNAYIDGLEYGLRSQRRITINTGEAKK